MNFTEYKSFVSAISIGKQLPNAVYLHESAFSTLPSELGSYLQTILSTLNLSKVTWNLIKFYKRDFKVTLLYYPNFTDYAYPALSRSHTIDLEKMTVTSSNYEQSENPPILHRKETFVKDDHPLRKLFIDITAEGEAIGLYDNPRTIGFKKSWERLIKSKGYYLDDKGRLHPLIDKPTIENISATQTGDVARHKTALNRNQLSQPMKILARHNFLDGEFSVFDYGCGKGDDIRELEAHGLDVYKWDPIYYKDESKTTADIVNLGFVINVIEDREERTQTLIDAWSYTNKLLVVSVMIAGDATIRQFTPYKDGVITKINTFQKYYSQGEIRHYIEHTLDQNAIPVSQGVFIIFKDKIEEQIFLLERQYVHRDWQQKTIREKQSRHSVPKKTIYEKNLELFDHYWRITLNLGRIPANDEFEFSSEIRKVTGSHKKAHTLLLEIFGENTFKEAESKRKEDLLVYFALSLFEKRRPQTLMPETLKRDIKAFFGTYTSAINTTKHLLFSLGDTKVIQSACSAAYETLQCGNMQIGHSYTFHKKYLGDLPPELRIYIGCATQLYGDLDDIQLIKAHITSGKVSLMGYDDWDKEQPLLLERIKIKLREQDVDFFDYVGEYTPPPLEDKFVY